MMSKSTVVAETASRVVAYLTAHRLEQAVEQGAASSPETVALSTVIAVAAITAIATGGIFYLYVELVRTRRELAEARRALADSKTARPKPRVRA